MSDHPHFGVTRHGLKVHARTIDHHPDGSTYAKFNKHVALALTRYVGTMTCFWVFCCLSLSSLPAVLSGFAVFHGTFPAIIVKASIIALVAWVAQTLIQLVLLPALMVGQNLQNEAADARAAKTFEDVETVMDRLDIHTEGGIKEVLDAVAALRGEMAARPKRRELAPWPRGGLTACCPASCPPPYGRRWRSGCSTGRCPANSARSPASRPAN
jgi:hypothetical protein